ncbi:UPF0182 family protein [Dehalococcoidia bacterium]|nr:UPF0182 family protein [Dehalococcoidia bacterium]
MAEQFERSGPPPLNFGGGAPINYGPIVKWGSVIVALIAVFALVSFFRGVYTDLLWFDSLDVRGVYTKVILTRGATFFVGMIAFGVGVAISLRIAHHFAVGTVGLQLPTDMVNVVRKAVVWGSVAAIVALSLIFGAIFSSRWELFLKFFNSVSFDRQDPVFGRDLAFYVFDLPVLSFIQGWLLGALVVILISGLVLHLVNYTIRGENFKLTTAVRVQISIMAALIMFTIAWGHWLDRWELVSSDGGTVFGATFADVNARKPALLILTVVASASGVLMLLNAYMKGIRILVGAIVLWLILMVLLGVAWPTVIQQFNVTPNEFAKEKTYIQHNMDFTRLAFGLDSITENFYAAESVLTSEKILDNLQTINNIRLWDDRPLSNVYRQIQLIRPYYDFKGADVDRYTINGEYRQVLLSAREVAPDRLEPETQTWINHKLVYTHGIGIAMSPVTEFTPEGRPIFFAKDIPSNGVIPVSVEDAVGEPDLLVDNPRIYYGENTTDYIVANSNTEELDYQTTEGDLIRTKYWGTGGVPLSSYFRKLAYAWEMADINILISGEITSESVIQYRRSIQERISTIAPFLKLDEDPYIVIAEGKLFWIQDAYTITDKYPYSDPEVVAPNNTFNYIRNSVKVILDAYDGSLTFYIWDPIDPIVRTYDKIFPGLFVNAESMSDDLRTHVRYPRDLFVAQAEKYIKYHMKDPQNFYNNEDLWATANEKFGQTDNLQPVEPYYVIMKLPSEEHEEFVLLFPYTPNQRQNLIGWLAARSDGENYGKMVAFNFPKDANVDGPEQVEARIDNDQDISAWFTLRCAEGSICIRGNLLVIPLADTILYAEPVYIQAEGVIFPELKRVILATADKVVMEDSLGLALAELTGDQALASVGGVSESKTTPNSPLPVSPVLGNPSDRDAMELQIQVVTETIDLIRNELTQLEEVLYRLQESTKGE